MPLRGGPGAIHRARALRHDMTIPERQLWPGLRRGLLGARFRRQHPVPPYTLDFACVALRLAIELDGSTHLNGDTTRDAALARQGWLVTRFWNNEVTQNLPGVLTRIAEIIHQRIQERQPHNPTSTP